MRSSDSLTHDQYLVTHYVDVGQSGMRLDHFLKERYRRRSRESLKKAIGSGAISLKRSQGPHVEVGRLKPGMQLLGGDQILVLSERRPEPEVSFDYKILYEDQGLFVIDKPGNLPVHPAGKYFFNTLLVHLKTRGHQDPLRPEREYFLVHRIDKETSGVLVLARDRAVCAGLTKQFALRQTEKTYLAIVHGHPPEVFQNTLAMKRDEGSRIKLKMRVVRPGELGLAASTEFRRLSTHGAYSLVQAAPRSGRQHQIRVHLESSGFPIVGDKLYGMPEEESLRYYERTHLSPEACARLILPRHALHAHRIEFKHPLTGEKKVFSSELPEDLRHFLAEQDDKAHLPALLPRAP